MIISSCHLKATNGLKNAPKAISEGLKFKNFLGGHASRPPDKEHCHAQSLRLPPPQKKISLSIILSPLSIFLNETLHLGQHTTAIMTVWLESLWAIPSSRMLQFNVMLLANCLPGYRPSSYTAPFPGSTQLFVTCRMESWESLVSFLT